MRFRASRIAAASLAAAALTAAAPAPAAPTARTLDEITIEGELRLPQVLFITSRESVRPLDWLDHYAPPSAAEVARDTPLPSRIHVIPSPEAADVGGDPPSASVPRSPREPEETTKETQR